MGIHTPDGRQDPVDCYSRHSVDIEKKTEGLNQIVLVKQRVDLKDFFYIY